MVASGQSLLRSVCPYASSPDRRSCRPLLPFARLRDRYNFDRQRSHRHGVTVLHGLGRHHGRDPDRARDHFHMARRAFLPLHPHRRRSGLTQGGMGELLYGGRCQHGSRPGHRHLQGGGRVPGRRDLPLYVQRRRCGNHRWPGGRRHRWLRARDSQRSQVLGAHAVRQLARCSRRRRAARLLLCF